MRKNNSNIRRAVVMITIVCIWSSLMAFSSDAQTTVMSSSRQKIHKTAAVKPAKGAQTQAKDLFLSLGSGNRDYFERLLQSGANPNTALPNNGKTLLMVAEQADISSMLLKFGADPTKVDHRGATALHYAISSGDALRIIPMLLENGAPVDAKAHGWAQQTPFLIATKLYFQGRDPAKYAKVMHLLAKHGAEMDAADESGHTPLIYAVVNDKPDLVRLMIELGADLEFKARDGLSALDWAEELGFVDIVEMLETSLQ